MEQVHRIRNQKILEPNAAAFGGKMVGSIEEIPANEAELIPKLLSSFRAAKRKQQNLSAPYAPGGGWKDLEAQRHRYHDAMSRNDTAAMARYLRNFFRNEGIDGLWGGEKVFETFCDSGQDRAITMLQHFAVWQSVSAGFSLEDLEAPRIGNPWGYLVSGRLLCEPVFEYHFQARYFKRLLSRLRSPVVLEIGGGFGGLAYQILKCMPNAKYIGLDLPENILLQSYYLSCAFPRARILAYDSSFATLDRQLIDAHDIVLLPNFAMPQIATNVADLVVNVRSLCEMSFDTIVEYLAQIDRIGRGLFFHENIFKPRRDGLFGIPACDFPEMNNFTMAAACESRWPKYQKDSAYPCQEYLYVHRHVFGP